METWRNFRGHENMCLFNLIKTNACIQCSGFLNVLNERHFFVYLSIQKRSPIFYFFWITFIKLDYLIANFNMSPGTVQLQSVNLKTVEYSDCNYNLSPIFPCFLHRREKASLTVMWITMQSLCYWSRFC